MRLLFGFFGSSEASTLISVSAPSCSITRCLCVSLTATSLSSSPNGSVKPLPAKFHVFITTPLRIRCTTARTLPLRPVPRPLWIVTEFSAAKFLALMLVL